ncbi:MutS domain V, partial [Helicosporidium sp. ATCC 50920]
RQGVVGLLLRDAELRGALRNLHLRGVPDVGALKNKLERGKASLQDLCTLYRASARLPSLMSALEEGLARAEAERGTEMVENLGDDAEASPLEAEAAFGSSVPALPSPASLLRQRFLAPLRACHAPEALVRFEELLEAAVDLDRIPDEYLIAASYDAALQSLQSRREELEEEIAEASAAAAEDLGLQLDKTLKMEWHRSANTRVRCLRITAKEERAVRGKLQKGYLELETRKDGIKFTNRRLKKAADALWALSAEYEGRQADLVAQVVGVAATFVPLWDEVGSVLADLDVLAALAEVAASAPLPYCRPELLPAEAGLLDFEALRHACVEVQDGVSYVPNDARLERGRSWFQLVTGPNMGGKSTHLRAVGVAVLLAQIGSYVPAASARVALRDAVFTRVGAGDCQLRGVSTFMAEMLETAALLRAATADSLVIVDELGRGTSTWDGLGLAWAIAEHLMSSVQAATLFATHFHELTALQGPGGVANFHVDAAVDPATGSVTMLYALHPGSCDESFGIHVAEYARFPPEIVAEAKRTTQAAERALVGKKGGDQALDPGSRAPEEASALL